MTGPAPHQPPLDEPSLTEYSTVELPLVEPPAGQQPTEQPGDEQPGGEQPGGEQPDGEPWTGEQPGGEPWTGEQPIDEQSAEEWFTGEPPAAGPVIPAQRTPAEETPVATVGDITVMPTTVRTPHGEFALRGTSWQVNEEWTPYRQLPGWALLAALLGLFVAGPFSVLFLIIRQTIYRGTAEVTVYSWTRQHVTRVPLDDLTASDRLRQQLTYVRSLASF